MAGRGRIFALLALVAVLATACGGGGQASGASADLSEAKIGFLFVGPRDDFGYNQAAFAGSEAVAAAFPDHEVLTQENVPETQEAERVMEDMIEKGAGIIFATSFGHLGPAVEVAKRHPEVIVLHQGGLEPEPMDNFGTYFGTVYEPVYEAGIAAGAASQTGKLGFVAAFPIAQTLANVNAFHLGARSVNPDVTTTVVFTSSWCDPAIQAEAAQSLLDQDIDVLTQHQDCTKTIVETAEAAGAFSVGYHADASALAPGGWLVGSVWDWGDLYVDIVQTALDGSFVGSPYDGDFRVGLRTGDNPFVLTELGPGVSAETAALIDAAAERFRAGGSPFDGPVADQQGAVRVPEGESPSYQVIEQMDYLAEGVIGEIPG